MMDLALKLKNRPGALAEMGEILGKANLSVEGGGGFVFDGNAIAHFLFEDAFAARKVLVENGIEVLAINEVLFNGLSRISRDN